MPQRMATMRMKQMMPAAQYPRASQSPLKMNQMMLSSVRIFSSLRRIRHSSLINHARDHHEACRNLGAGLSIPSPPPSAQTREHQSQLQPPTLFASRTTRL